MRSIAHPQPFGDGGIQSPRALYPELWNIRPSALEKSAKFPVSAPYDLQASVAKS